MKQQFNLLILICLTLMLFGCDTLHRGEELRGQQDPGLRSRVNFGSDWQFQRLRESLPSPGQWEIIFLAHSLKIEPLVVNDQWQGRSLNPKSFFVEKGNNFRSYGKRKFSHKIIS